MTSQVADDIMILIIIFKKAMQFHAQDFPIVWLDRSRPDGQQPTDPNQEQAAPDPELE